MLQRPAPPTRGFTTFACSARSLPMALLGTHHRDARTAYIRAGDEPAAAAAEGMAADEARERAAKPLDSEQLLFFNNVKKAIDRAVVRPHLPGEAYHRNSWRCERRKA